MSSLDRLPVRIRRNIKVTDVIYWQSPCWDWTKALTEAGYARIPYKGKTRRGHRVTYVLLVGPIPDGLVLDHRCKRPCCVNPAHLEAVTQRVNVQRSDNATKTECINGHDLIDPANVYIRPNSPGYRMCRTCKRDYTIASRLRKYGLAA